MDLLVDTSVWSLAFRRDAPTAAPALTRLHDALTGGESIYTTGLVLQELLQGFHGPTARGSIIERFDALPLLVPDRQDHIEAATLRNTCRRNGVAVGTVDALLAQLGRRHDLLLLTTDRDFERMADHIDVRLWRS